MKAEEHSAPQATGATGTVARPRSAEVLPDFVEGPYRVHFARDERDLQAVLRLRFEVFNLELGEGLAASFATGLDRDDFDDVCHHLMVTDRRTGELVGTYRMQTAEMAAAGRGFYTSQEFAIEDLPPRFLERSIELGRACIAERHRNGLVLFALWRGLAAYVRWTGKLQLFGCCSLTTQDQALGRRMQRQLERQGHFLPDVHVAPRPGLECGPPGPEDDEPCEVPRLFGTYLRFGAKACGPPAIDREFRTIDFLVVIDVGALDARVRALFFHGLPEPPA